jgi:hypothetical protein
MFMYQINVTGKVASLGYNKIGFRDELLGDSGFNYSQIRAAKIVADIAEPKDAMDAYSGEVKGVAAKYAELQIDDFKSLKALGIPDKQAYESSKRKALSGFKHEMDILRLAHPVASDSNLIYDVSAKAGHSLSIKDPLGGDSDYARVTRKRKNAKK